MASGNNHVSEARVKGFNYGVGWGKDPKPPIYLEGMRVSRELGDQLMTMSRIHWEIEMALRDVRLAETGAEKAKAVLVLQTLLNKLFGIKH